MARADFPWHIVVCCSRVKIPRAAIREIKTREMSYSGVRTMLQQGEEAVKHSFVYIVRCSDGSYYTGWTNDLEKRIKHHNEGRQGAKYTRSRRPVALVYYEECDTPEEAMSREWHIKRLTRAQKQKLIDGCAAKPGAPCDGEGAPRDSDDRQQIK